MMRGMEKTAKGGALRAKTTQRGSKANAIIPVRPPAVHQDFSIVYAGAYPTNIDGSHVCETCRLEGEKSKVPLVGLM
jgi:hypothetical protein